MSRQSGFSLILLIPLLITISRTSGAEQAVLLQGVKRIVFVGDSNTHAGKFIAFVEAALLKQPRTRAIFVNLGLPSETVSGLSEPAHPFPRPCLHERLDRVLEKSKPDLVVAAYGMNDGIYYPFDEQRFQAFQQGVDRLIERVNQSGAKLILLTPTPFDAVPLRRGGKLRSDAAQEFAWFSPFENYDSVLRRYAEWVLRQRDRVTACVDVHSPITKHVELQRASNPDFTISGDGIHYDDAGHRIVADSLLACLGRKPVDVSADLMELLLRRQHIMRDAWLSAVGHTRPDLTSGLPMENARRQAAELERDIQAVTDHQ